MTETEYIQHWNYFCSLTERLEETKNYVYHGLDEKRDDLHKLVHADVYSDNFKQILLLAAAEFEIISKALCVELGGVAKNIVEISKIILEKFPQMGKTEVMTVYFTFMPLSEWEYTSEDDKKVKGLAWWGAYNSLKHNEKNSYAIATLENAISSLGSLYVLNLYLMYAIFKNLSIAYLYPPAYFRSKYTSSPMLTRDGLLPDFGNKSPYERTNEIFPGMFKKNE